MATDAFGRVIRNIDTNVGSIAADIKAALLRDVGAKKPFNNLSAADKEKDEEHIKLIAKSLKTIVDYNIDKDIDQLNKNLVKLTNALANMNKKRAEIKTENTSRSSGSSSGGGSDPASRVRAMVDKTARTFSQRLGDAATEIGKGTVEAFGELFKGWEKLSPVKLYKMANDQIGRGLDALGGVIKSGAVSLGKLYKWANDEISKGITIGIAKIAQGFKWANDQIGKGVEFLVKGIGSIASAIGGVFASIGSTIIGAVGSLGTFLYNQGSATFAKYFGKVFASAGSVASAIGDRGSKFFGALFKGIGKGIEKLRPDKVAKSDLGETGQTGDIPGQPSSLASAVANKEEYQRLDNDFDELCRCLCECIKSTSSKEQALQKITARYTQSQGKATAQTASEITKQGKEDKEKKKRDKYGALPPPASPDEQKAMDARKKAWEGTIKGVKAFGPKLADGLIKSMKSENPVQEALVPLAEGFSSFFGAGLAKTVALPFKIAAGIEIAGFKAEFLGPVGDIIGSVFGGMAEGFLKLVLHPLAEEIAYFGETTAATFAVKGGGLTTGASVKLGGAGGGPAPNAGAEWTDISKHVADYNAGLDGGLERLHTWQTTMMDIDVTGQRTKVLQDAQLKNYRRGITEASKLNKVTRTALSTATQLDARADETNDLFATWSLHLGVSNLEIGQMARGLNTVAKTTGIFGTELINIAKSSEKFMENMRLAGTFTAQSSTNMIGLLASASKTGVSKGMNNLLDILSKSAIDDNSPLGQLVKQATGGKPGLIEQLLGGTITSNKESLRDLANGLSGAAANFVPGAGRGGANLEEAYNKLDPNVKGLRSSQFRQQYGVDLNELILLIKAIKENTRSFNETLGDLNKKSVKALSNEQIRNALGAKVDKDGINWQEKFNEQLKKAGGDTSVAVQELLKMENLPKEFRSQLQGELSLQQAKSQQDALFLDTGQNILTDLIKAAPKAGQLGKSFDTIVAGNKDFRQYLDQISGGKGKGPAGQAGATKVLTDVIDRANVQAKAAGLDQFEQGQADVEKAIAQAAKGDTTGLKALLENFNTFQQVLKNRQKAETDPLFAIQQTLLKIEGYFKEQLQPIIAGIAPIILGALKNLANQPFMKSLAKGDYTQAIKEFGRFLQELGKGAREQFNQLIALNGKGLANDVQVFTSELSAIFATIAEPLTTLFGKIFEFVIPVVVKGFVDAVNRLFPDIGSTFDYANVSKWLKMWSEQVNSLLDFDIKGWLESAEKAFDNVSKVIEIILGFLNGTNGLTNTLGVVLVGALGSIALVLGGPAGVIALLVATSGAFGDITKWLSDIINLNNKKEGATKEEALSSFHDLEKGMKEAFDNFGKTFEEKKKMGVPALEGNLAEADRFRKQATEYEKFKGQFDASQQKIIQAAADRLRKQADEISDKSRKAISENIKQTATTDPVKLEKEIAQRKKNEDSYEEKINQMEKEKKQLVDQVAVSKVKSSSVFGRTDADKAETARLEQALDMKSKELEATRGVQTQSKLITGQESVALIESKAEALFNMYKEQVKPEDWEKLRTATQKFAMAAGSFSKIEDIPDALKKELAEKIKTIKTENGTSIDLIDANKKLIESTAALNKAREAEQNLNSTKRIFAKSLVSGGGKGFGLDERGGVELQGFLKTKLGIAQDVGTKEFKDALSEIDPTKLIDALQDYIKKNGANKSLDIIIEQLQKNTKAKESADEALNKVKIPGVVPPEVKPPGGPAPGIPQPKAPGAPGIPDVVPPTRKEKAKPEDVKPAPEKKPEPEVKPKNVKPNEPAPELKPGQLKPGTEDEQPWLHPNNLKPGRPKLVAPDIGQPPIRVLPPGGIVPPPDFNDRFERRGRGKHRFFTPRLPFGPGGPRMPIPKRGGAGANLDLALGKDVEDLGKGIVEIGKPIVNAIGAIGDIGKPIADAVGKPVADAAAAVGKPIADAFGGLFGPRAKPLPVEPVKVPEVPPKPVEPAKVPDKVPEGAGKGGIGPGGELKPEIKPPEPVVKPLETMLDISKAMLGTLIDIKSILLGNFKPENLPVPEPMPAPEPKGGGKGGGENGEGKLAPPPEVMPGQKPGGDPFKPGPGGNPFLPNPDMPKQDAVSDIFKGPMDFFNSLKAPDVKSGIDGLLDMTKGFPDLIGGAFNEFKKLQDAATDIGEDPDVTLKPDDNAAPMINKLGGISSMIPGFNTLDEVRKQMVMPNADSDKSDEETAKNTEDTANNTKQMTQMLAALVALLGSGSPNTKQAMMNAKNLGPFLASILETAYPNGNYGQSADIGMNVVDLQNV